MDAAHERRRHVGEILVEEGIIGADDLARALAEQSRAPRPLGKIIVDLGLASAGAVANALAEQHGGLLKTEYGVSTGLTRHAPPEEPEPEGGAEEAAQPQPHQQPQVSTDVLAAWQKAVADRDALIERLTAAVRERDAELARLNERPEPSTDLSAATSAELDAARAQVRELTAQLDAVRAEGAAAAEARESELELLTAEVSARDVELARVRAEHESAAGAARQELEQRLAAAHETEVSELERRLGAAEAVVRSRDAELAVLRLQEERRAEAEASTAAQEPEPEREHVLFLLSDGGYRIERREGPAPAPGESVAGDLVVVRVGPSPLPDGPRTCAYLAAR